jgi:hypothetical protein
MATSQPEWEPTEQDLDLYRKTVSERMKALANSQGAVLPIDQYEEIWPLWMWMRAVEQRDQFIAEFQSHLTAWWRMAHPNASLLSEDHRAFKVFYANLLLRWRWCYLQLLVATAGMPQPLRRRMRLCDLSHAEQQAIQIAVGQALHSPASGRLNPANRFNPQTPFEPLH